MTPEIDSIEAINQINWRAFPPIASRIIKEMLEDITSEVDIEPEESERIRREVASVIYNVSGQQKFHSAHGVGKRILDVLEDDIISVNEITDPVQHQLALIGNSLLRISKV